jgi:hypothetical protein
MNDRSADKHADRPNVTQFAASWVAGPRGDLAVKVIVPPADLVAVPPFINIRAGGVSINVTTADDADYLAALINKAATNLRAIEAKESK